MRVLMVSPGVWPLPSPKGGVEKTIYHVVNELAKLGCQVDLVSDVADGAEFHHGVTIHRLAHHSIPLLYQLGFVGYALRYAVGQTLAFVKTLMLKSDYDVLHAEGRLIAPLAIFHCKKRVPSVYRVNDEPPAKGEPHHMLYRISYRMVEGAARKADRVIIIDHKQKDYFIQQGIAPEKIRFIPDGIDTNTFKPQPDGQRDYGLFVGFLNHRKGVEYLIRGMAELKGPDCVIVGHGPERSRLTELAQSLGVGDRVHFTGVVSDPQKLAEIYNSSAFLVIPSTSECGIPLAVLEAMACGLPIIASPIAAIPSVVQDGYNGFLVEPHDIKTLAQRMNTLFNSPDLREQMGQRSLAMFAQERSFQAQAKSFLNLYQEMVSKRR
jgi:glycosyltransferase involved in cell wall biosynthesis